MKKIVKKNFLIFFKIFFTLFSSLFCAKKNKKKYPLLRRGDIFFFTFSQGRFVFFILKNFFAKIFFRNFFSDFSWRVCLGNFGTYAKLEVFGICGVLSWRRLVDLLPGSRDGAGRSVWLCDAFWRKILPWSVNSYPCGVTCVREASRGLYAGFSGSGEVRLRESVPTMPGKLRTRGCSFRAGDASCPENRRG